MMQAQMKVQQIGVSAQQSMEIVKTLLSASFGYAHKPDNVSRNLLPEENFSEGRLTAGDHGCMSYDPSQKSGNGSRYVSSVAVKIVSRGFSTEADKLLNFLEEGIFHAIERQYLKSFMFAIYLDQDDPNNIIEAYTYKINYFEIAGTGVVVPLLSLDDQMNKMSLKGSKVKDPVANATMSGKAPTLRDVKDSVRMLIRNLVVTIQALEPLPVRRYGMFKLFYREDVPEDYEPPYFRPADPQKHEFVFTTHGKDEVPERFQVGSVKTPYHGVELEVQSVAKYLPTSEGDNSQFAGVMAYQRRNKGKAPLAPESTTRACDLEIQRADAQKRTVVWSAEGRALADSATNGDLDPGCADDSGISLPTLLGFRKEDGKVTPEEHEDVEMGSARDGGQYFGATEEVPSHVGKLVQGSNRDIDMENTQALETTQTLAAPRDLSHEVEYTGSPDTLGGSVISHGINTQVLKGMVEQNHKLAGGGATVSYSEQGDDLLEIDTQAEQVGFSTQSRASVRSRDENPDNTDCLCDTMDGDDLVQCEGACQRWYHLWCMGYHDQDDPRLPDCFFCIPCRLKSDPLFVKISHKYSSIEDALKDLATFRRVIKLVQKEEKITNSTMLKKLLSCTSGDADIFWRRLKNEGFIIEEVTEIDQLGLIETQHRQPGAKRKTKGAGMGKRSKPPTFVFNNEIVGTEEYRQYFTPDGDAMLKMIGLGPSRRDRTKKKTRISPQQTNDTCVQVTETQNKSLAVRPDVMSINNVKVGCEKQAGAESQTQDDTQFPDMAAALAEADFACGLKRRNESVSGRKEAQKKLKVSIGDGVDMEE